MSTPYIIWWAIAVHVAWGVGLFFDPTLRSIAILGGLHWLIAFGISEQLLGTVLVVAACAAAAGLLLGHRLSNGPALLLLLPQYALLVASVVSDAQSIITGTIGDRPIDRTLLFTALWPVIVAGLLHTIAISERHRRWNR